MNFTTIPKISFAQTMKFAFIPFHSPPAVSVEGINNACNHEALDVKIARNRLHCFIAASAILTTGALLANIKLSNIKIIKNLYVSAAILGTALIGLTIIQTFNKAVGFRNFINSQIQKHNVVDQIQKHNVVDQIQKHNVGDMKKLSEALGNSIGRSLESMPSIPYDVDSLIKGIREGVEGKPSPLSEKEFEEMMRIVQEKAFEEQSEVNLKAANEFIEKNKNEANVKEIVPGKLQYTVLKEGTGPVVEPHASPKIHCIAKYQNGTVFATSEEMGEPFTIPLDETIPGFSKGIAGMKEGEKRRLFIHPDLGFGTASEKLPPNTLIIFDVEVINANTEDENNDDDEGYHFDEETKKKLHLF